MGPENQPARSEDKNRHQEKQLPELIRGTSLHGVPHN